MLIILPRLGVEWGGGILGFSSEHFYILSSLPIPPLPTTTVSHFHNYFLKSSKSSKRNPGRGERHAKSGAKVINGWLCLIKSEVYYCLILGSPPSMLIGLKSPHKKSTLEMLSDSFPDFFFLTRKCVNGMEIERLHV